MSSNRRHDSDGLEDGKQTHLVAKVSTRVAAKLKAKEETRPQPTPTTLRTIPLLADFPDSLLKKLVAVADWGQYQPGNEITRQNEVSGAVYFVVSGCVKILRGGGFADVAQATGKQEMRLRSRHHVVVALVGAGDIIGELGALLECGRSATIVALTPCQIVSIPCRDFMACMQRHPPFAIAVASKIARRLVDTNRQVELMRGKVEDRVQALNRYCASLGLNSERLFSNAEIARMVGASRVAVSQIVNRLRRERDETNLKIKLQTGKP
jgi:CRP/FNR family cyclic AMP-dependent transcriptional regulator